MNIPLQAHCAAALLLLLLPLAASAQTPNLRTGGYDVAMSVSVGGAPPRLTRYKTCVTKEDLASLKAFAKDEDCKYQFGTRSATRISGSTVCNIGGTQGKGEFDIQFPTPESYVMTSSNRVGGQPASDSRFELKGRWASPNCVGYDD